MKLAISLVLTALVAAIQCVVGIPIILEKRALQKSLRETGKETPDWHFGLVIHPPDSISISGSEVEITEHLVNEARKCFVYGDASDARPTRERHLSITATLLRNGEPDDNSLETKVKGIIKAVPPSSQRSVLSGKFNNCFDFAVEAVRRLNAARYVSDADYNTFREYYNKHSAAVKAATDQGIIALCTRGNGKPCNPGKASAKVRSGWGKARANSKVPTVSKKRQ